MQLTKQLDRHMTSAHVRRLLHRAGSFEIFPWIELLLGWWELARQRRDLAALDERALHDVGLSRSDIAGEISKPFWRR
jgi:uncharacterized protein YjiS (DUF1127 family)